MSFIINPFRYTAAGLAVDAVTFDGSNDSMNHGGAGLTGVANSKVMVFSCWLKFEAGGDGAGQHIFNVGSSGDEAFTLRKGADDKLVFKLTSTAGAEIMEMLSSSAWDSTDGWIHIAAGADLSVPISRLVINGTDDKGAVNNLTDATINWTDSGNAFAGSDISAGTLLDADMAELYFDETTYIDFSDSDKVALFRDGDNKPVDLGADGSTPNAVQPIIYQHIDNGEAADNFKLNAGTGGDFTVVGALTTASTSPSD